MFIEFLFEGSHGDLVSNSEDDSDIYSQLDSIDR